MVPEYVPQGRGPAELPKTRSDGTAKTDKSPSVSFGSAVPPHFSPITSVTFETLKTTIISALDGEPEQFDRRLCRHCLGLPVA